MAADWRSCVSGGWDHLQCWGLCGWDGCYRCPGGGERHQRSSQLLSLSLKGLAAGRVAGAIPTSDAASQDALNGASVESAHDGGRGFGSSEFAEEVETLLCFLGQCCSVVSPGEVLCDVHTQKLGAARSPTVAPLMVRGACWVCALLKSTTISFVFSTFRERLLTLHHPARRLTSLL